MFSMEDNIDSLIKKIEVIENDYKNQGQLKVKWILQIRTLGWSEISLESRLHLNQTLLIT